MIEIGKYDKIVNTVQYLTRGRLILLIVLDGKEGSGFSVSTVPELRASLPAVLRGVAQQLEGG